MFRLQFLLFLLGNTFYSYGQLTTGLTGERDTSFSAYNAWKKLLKTYPDAKIVKEFSSERVAEARGISYCTLGDRKLHLDAFYPKSNQKTKRNKMYPAVLLVHGGGWRSGDREQHIPLAQRLAALGYVCFTVEYRLSTEAIYPAAVYDLKAAVRWVRSNNRTFNLDTSKIAILGFSAGGELAAFVGVTNNNPVFADKGCNLKTSDAVQAIIDIDGILSFVHPESGEGDDRKSISAATYWLGYPKKDNLKLWTEASSLSYVGKTTPPVLFLNSSVDRMHAGRDDFRKILNVHQIYSEVHTFEGAPHAFCLFDPWFEPTVKYTAGFLDKVFKK